MQDDNEKTSERVETDGIIVTPNACYPFPVSTGPIMLPEGATVHPNTFAHPAMEPIKIGSANGLLGKLQHCQCKFEIQNNLPRTKHCLVACDEPENLKPTAVAEPVKEKTADGKKHPDFNEWLLTGEGAKCNNFNNLKEQKYLTNRLFWAFDAGRNCIWDQYIEFKNKTSSLEAVLGELLALLHGDGGHYQVKNGTEKAIKDAIKLFHKEWVVNEHRVGINQAAGIQSINFPMTTMDAKLKELVWKLDREIWAKVEVHEATQSWGREQSAKLIAEYFGTIEEKHKESELRQKIIDAQRITLSEHWAKIQELEAENKRLEEQLKAAEKEAHNNTVQGCIDALVGFTEDYVMDDLIKAKLEKLKR